MDEVLKLILEALELADAARLEQLDETIREVDVKRQALELEQARLASKYGPDSAEARQAAARRQAQVALLAEAQEEFERLTSPMPEPDTVHGVLYGRVLTKAGAGAAELVVAALLADGKVVAETTTTERGAFGLRLSVRDSPQVLLQVRPREKGGPLYKDAKPREVTAGALTRVEIRLTDPKVRR